MPGCALVASTLAWQPLELGAVTFGSPAGALEAVVSPPLLPHPAIAIAAATAGMTSFAMPGMSS